MNVSIELNPELEQKYRDYAASQGMTVSQFVCKAADDVIAQAGQERQHRQEVEEFKQRIQALRAEFLATKPKATEEDIERMRLERCL